LHAGAVGVGLDLVDGCGVHAAWGGRAVRAHPDTGAALLGRSAPAWRESLVLAARAAATVGLDLLGVDVLVDRRRGPVIVELNARPGLTIQVANRLGLVELLDEAAAAAIPSSIGERVALGQRLYSSSSRAYS
jgi:hypothetical protein